MLVLLPAPLSPAASSSNSQVRAAVGIIIPLYVSSTSGAWQKIVTEKEKFANVSYIVILNPDSGVGVSRDPKFASDVKNLQDAGIIALGYDWTGYGSVSQKDVEGNMTDYKNWYAVNGIFFDGMSSSISKASYYETDASFAKSLGFNTTVGNPGTTVNSKLYNIFTFLNIWETHNLPSPKNLNTNEPSSQQSFIANDLSSFPAASKLNALSEYISYLFITKSPSYGGLPPYLDSELSYLSHS